MSAAVSPGGPTFSSQQGTRASTRWSVNRRRARRVGASSQPAAAIALAAGASNSSKSRSVSCTGVSEACSAKPCKQTPPADERSLRGCWETVRQCATPLRPRPQPTHRRAPRGTPAWPQTRERAVQIASWHAAGRGTGPWRAAGSALPHRSAQHVHARRGATRSSSCRGGMHRGESARIADCQ